MSSSALISRHLRLALAALPILVLTPACTDDGAVDEDSASAESSGDGDGDGDPATGDGDGDATATSGDGDGEPATGDGDGDAKPGLGETPNVLCEAALANLDLVIAEAQGGYDPLAIEAAYVGTGLQEFVQLAGATTGRIEAGVLIDDAAILASIAAALDSGDPLDMLDVQWRIYLAMHQYMRHEIADVAATLPNPANDPALLYARWDAAYCYYDGALRPLAQTADGFGLGDTIESAMDGAFVWGHDNIEGEAAWAIDEWTVPAAKQVVEKSSFAIFHRLVMQWSDEAASLDEPMLAARAARSAYGAFQLIEDRMAGKNTPGIDIIEEALLEDPGQIDPAALLTELNIAFVKRTRKYTDYALPEIGALMGTPEGYVGANEGATYSRVVEPFIEELGGFDREAYQAMWSDYINAIEADDLAAAEAASAELTDWNCQLQAELGIAECTSSIDEEG